MWLIIIIIITVPAAAIIVIIITTTIITMTSPVNLEIIIATKMNLITVKLVIAATITTTIEFIAISF
jgi:hypothetical protein